MHYVIVNADDFGNSEGINYGIIEAHERGIVTSTSLMVNTPATAAAVKLARAYPNLGLGLHVNLTGEGERLVDLEDRQAVKRELEEQFNRFADLTGQFPTHLDSHQHVHREFNVGHLFIKLSLCYGLPLRGYSEVVYNSRFYGQWEYGKTEERYISVEFLISLLKAAKRGITEIACHPGYVVAEFNPVYNWEREVELQALTNPRVKSVIEEEGIQLINYQDYLRLAEVA